VIINGEKNTGVTIHEMVEDVDAGDILYQEALEIDEFETSFSLYNKQISAFINIFDDFFIRLVENRLKPRKMQGGGRYYPREIPFNGIINTEWPIKKVEAFIRAMHFPPFRGALLKLGDEIMECDTFEQYLVLTGRV
jgi:methionyl-tRNA formyltransferase